MGCAQPFLMANDVNLFYSKAIKIVKATSRVRSQSQPVTVTRWSSPALVSRRDWCTSPSMTRPHSSRETFTCRGVNKILRRFSQHLEKAPTRTLSLLKTPIIVMVRIFCPGGPLIQNLFGYNIMLNRSPPKNWDTILLVVWLQKIQRSHRMGSLKIL